MLHYALAGKDLASGLMLYQGPTENYFLAMVQPPARPAPEAVPPREYVFVVDVSGSMEGFPLHTARGLMRDLLGRLRPTDHFDVVLFSGATALFATQSVPATPIKSRRRCHSSTGTAPVAAPSCSRPCRRR